MKKIILLLTLATTSMLQARGVQAPPAATYILISGSYPGPTVTYTANAELYQAAYNANGGFIEGAAAGANAVSQDGANRMLQVLEAFKQRDPVFFNWMMSTYGLQLNDQSK